MFKNKKEPLISFFTPRADLSKDELIVPKAAKYFIPEAWKQMPKTVPNPQSGLSIRKHKTAKACPSFADYFSQGVIVPAWCDMAFRMNPQTGQVEVATGNEHNPYDIGTHNNKQLLEYFSPYHKSAKANQVFKLVSPWYMKTRPGWSVLQLPLFYHDNPYWQAMAGVNDTDVHHILNIQVLYYGNGEEVLIKKGQPLAQYIPIERTKLSLDVRLATKKDLYDISSLESQIQSKARNGYRLLPRVPEKE